MSLGCQLLAVSGRHRCSLRCSVGFVLREAAGTLGEIELTQLPGTGMDNPDVPPGGARKLIPNSDVVDA